MTTRYLEPKDCNCCSNSFSGFKSLTSNELLLFKESKCKVEFSKGETLIKQGTPCTSLVCLKKGYAKLHMEGIDGKTILLQVLKAGDFIVSPGVFNDNLNHFTITALTNCETCLITRESFEQTFGSNQQFAQHVLKQNHLTTSFLHNQLIKLSFKKMVGRVADTLLYLSNDIYDARSFHTTLSRQDLADLSGVSKESFIRIMKDFKESGIVDIDGNNINILSISLLQNISRIG
jgi:CRP/FNR family transcriptional regulator